MNFTWQKSTEGRRVLPATFQAPLVRALLQPRDPKRRTRRIISAKGFEKWAGEIDARGWPLGWTCRDGVRQLLPIPSRYGGPTALLYVQESLVPVEGRTVYAATGEFVLDDKGEPVPWIWKVDKLAPRFCRKALSRLRLEVLWSAGEWLKRITEEEARLEGVRADNVGRVGVPAYSARQRFAELWDSIHDKDGERFDDDPGVFVVAFDEWERRASGEQVKEPAAR